tara:strand:- start:192 stop:515 length:324 start_codon:yes stop_codon:yes gene_type:complete
MKKIKSLISILFLMFFLFTSCSSIKEGLTGQNKKSGTDEFLVQKKSPLVLPPDFKKLPNPSPEKNSTVKEEEKNVIMNTIGIDRETKKLDKDLEQSILEKIIKNNVN